VSAAEGERWFLETHAPQLCALPGLRRFFSYRVVDDDVRLPGVWRDGDTPPPETVQHQWHRLSELWFDTLSDWKAAMVDGSTALTPPAWASRPGYPFVDPGRDFVSSFILERPSDEFLRDLRGYLP